MGDHRSESDVVDVLTTDHREVSGLIGLIGQIGQSLAGGSAEQRLDLAGRLISEPGRSSVAVARHVCPATLTGRTC